LESDVKTVEASLRIELNVECPHCEAWIDLMDDCGDLNVEGFISRQAMPNGDWSESHDKFELDIDCPKCSKKIHIKQIAW
jgi:DNA-directed RNA polymerase subunit RPC12/RpoP